MIRSGDQVIIPKDGCDIDELAALTIRDEDVVLPRTKGGTIRLNRQTIYKMAASGWSKTDLCKVLDITPGVIFDHFMEDFEAGKATIVPNLKALALKKAQVSDKVLVFMLKNFCGMSEDPQQQAADDSGVEWVTKAPKKPSHKKLTADEREELDAED